MQVRKGVRRIGALMLVLLATGAMADTPGAVEVPSPEAQAEILNLLERQALYRDRVDWAATRVRLQSAQGDPRNGWPFCAKPLRSARAIMADGRRPSASANPSRAQQAGAAAVDRAKAADAVDARIGWVVIEGYASTPGATPQENSARTSSVPRGGSRSSAARTTARAVAGSSTCVTTAVAPCGRCCWAWHRCCAPRW
jgi:hypothetical protein